MGVDMLLNEFNNNETLALSQDCELFHRERNPRSMGSRLVRHIFHDAAGGFDGFVNVGRPTARYI